MAQVSHSHTCCHLAKKTKVLDSETRIISSFLQCLFERAGSQLGRWALAVTLSSFQQEPGVHGEDLCKQITRIGGITESKLWEDINALIVDLLYFAVIRKKNAYSRMSVLLFKSTELFFILISNYFLGVPEKLRRKCLHFALQASEFLQMLSPFMLWSCHRPPCPGPQAGRQDCLLAITQSSLWHSMI